MFLTNLLGRVLGAIMKQVCWHSRRSFFFSVPRLCGSRQVVAHCCANERINQMHIQCPSLGSRKWKTEATTKHKETAQTNLQIPYKTSTQYSLNIKFLGHGSNNTQKHQKPQKQTKIHLQALPYTNCFHLVPTVHLRIHCSKLGFKMFK